MWMPPRGWAGGRGAVGRGQKRDCDRKSGAPMGRAAAADGAWAHVEYGLPGRQRRSASGFGPREIMSCPDGAERGRGTAGKIAVG